MLGLGLRLTAARRLPGLSPEAQAVIAAMVVPPSAARQTVIDTLCRSLVSADVWSRLGVLYVLAAHDRQGARLNWKAPSGTALTEVNGAGAGLTYTADRGFVGDGTGAYLDAGIGYNAIPSMAQDDAAAGVYVCAQSGPSGPAIGTIGASYTRILPSSGGNLVSTMNSNTQSGVAVASAVGHSVVTRSNASAYNRHKNGALLDSPAAVTTALAANNLALLRSNTTAVYGAGFTLSAAHAGASLTAQQVADLNAALLAYMQAVGAA